MLAWRIHRIADDVALIGRCLIEHIMAYSSPLRMIRRAGQGRYAQLDLVPVYDPRVFTLHEQKFKNGPQMDPFDIKSMGQKVSTDDYQHTEQQELKQQMQSFGCGEQDERPQGSDDEPNPGTRIVKNASARRSREIAEATDPRPYGIGRVSLTSSDDDEDVSQGAKSLQLPHYEEEAYKDSLGGTTLCDEDEQPQACLRGGYYQQRPDEHFGYYDCNDDDDPDPTLPHPHWIHDEGIMVTTNTTTQSVPVSAVTGPVPSSSVSVTAAAMPVNGNASVCSTSLEAVERTGRPSLVTNGPASHSDDDVPQENRYHMPPSRFRRAQIVQMSRDLENVRLRRNGRSVEGQTALQEADLNVSNTPSSSSVRSVENGEGSSANARGWRLRLLDEEEAARLHFTPEQWPEPSRQSSEMDDVDEEVDRDRSVREQHREYAQDQADEFVRQHPDLARPSRRSDMRGGGGGSVYPDEDQEEITSEETRLLDTRRRIQARGLLPLLEKLEQRQKRAEERIEEPCQLCQHSDLYADAPRYHESRTAEAARRHHGVHERRADGPRRHYHREDADLGEWHVLPDPYDSDNTNRRQSRYRVAADITRYEKPRATARAQPPSYPTALSREFGYQPYLEPDNDEESETFHYGIHTSKLSAESARQREVTYAKSQRRLTELEHQHALEAPGQPLVEWYNSRRIYHIPPSQQEIGRSEHAPARLFSHHLHMHQRLENPALDAVRAAQSLKECEAIKNCLGAQQGALEQRPAEFEAGDRLMESTRMPMTYVKTGDRPVMKPRRLRLSTTAERRLMSNAGKAARVNRNFKIDGEEVFAQHPTDYRDENQVYSNRRETHEGDEREVMDGLVSHRSGSVPLYMRGGASDPDDNQCVFLSPDYDPVAISQEITKLNIELAKAQKHPLRGQGNHAIIADLKRKIRMLKAERDYAEGSDVDSLLDTECMGGNNLWRDVNIRGGAGGENKTQTDPAAFTLSCNIAYLEEHLTYLRLQAAQHESMVVRSQYVADLNAQQIAELEKEIENLKVENSGSVDILEALAPTRTLRFLDSHQRYKLNPAMRPEEIKADGISKITRQPSIPLAQQRL